MNHIAYLSQMISSAIMSVSVFGVSFSSATMLSNVLSYLSVVKDWSPCGFAIIVLAGSRFWKAPWCHWLMFSNEKLQHAMDEFQSQLPHAEVLLLRPTLISQALSTKMQYKSLQHRCTQAKIQRLTCGLLCLKTVKSIRQQIQQEIVAIFCIKSSSYTYRTVSSISSAIPLLMLHVIQASICCSQIHHAQSKHWTLMVSIFIKPSIYAV